MSNISGQTSQTDFGASAARSRGVIFSDCNKTLVGLNHTSFFKEYAVYLAAMKHSGYTVILHSQEPGSNEQNLPMMFKMAGIGIEAEEFEYDGALVLSKMETAGMEGIVAFDDEPLSHAARVPYQFDTNDPHAQAAIIRIAGEFDASGRTKIFTFDAQDYQAPPAPGVAPVPSGGAV